MNNVMSERKHAIVWGYHEKEPLTAEPCPECDGRGRFYDGTVQIEHCGHCNGLGWFGIEPRLPVQAIPGSVEKIAMLSVRYASGVPLWNDEDGPAPGADDVYAMSLAS